MSIELPDPRKKLPKLKEVRIRFVKVTKFPDRDDIQYGKRYDYWAIGLYLHAGVATIKLPARPVLLALDAVALIATYLLTK